MSYKGIKIPNAKALPTGFQQSCFPPKKKYPRQQNKQTKPTKKIPTNQPKHHKGKKKSITKIKITTQGLLLALTPS